MTKREQEMRAKIKELLDKYSGESYGNLSDYEVTTLIALKAAEWADHTMLNKVCDHLRSIKKHASLSNGGGIMVPVFSEIEIAMFRKVMEEKL